MTLPNFLIIGAPKCGTTALYAALARHPQVYMSQVKEPNFFALAGRKQPFAGPDGDALQRNAMLSWEQYINLFAPAAEQRALGEASTISLTDYQPEQTTEHIHRRAPQMRLVAVLRQPAERAYSQFAFRRQRGFEPLASFQEALEVEGQRIAANWSPYCRYWRNGFYARNLKPYIELLPREQIRLYLYEEWCRQPHALWTDLYNFLGINPMVAADPIARVTDSYRSDILQLQTLIGRDLSHWFVPS